MDCVDARPQAFLCPLRTIQSTKHRELCPSISQYSYFYMFKPTATKAPIEPRSRREEELKSVYKCLTQTVKQNQRNRIVKQQKRSYFLRKSVPFCKTAAFALQYRPFCRAKPIVLRCKIGTITVSF